MTTFTDAAGNVNPSSPKNDKHLISPHNSLIVFKFFPSSKFFKPVQLGFSFV